MEGREPGHSVDQLRFLTCGSVDDGKSSLIGRLLYDSNQIFEDQLRSLREDSRKYGTTGDDIDLALLMDGLESEREQSITIDVGYRYFSTAKRSFIVADSPGHEQFTRNMATAASNSELAVVLVDACKGVTIQTRRHATICSIFGIRHVVLAVNKMDLVQYSQGVFEGILKDFSALTDHLSFASVAAIPMSAKLGDNVVNRSSNMDWYSGHALLQHLESVTTSLPISGLKFRLPVQWVNRPNADFRGFSGTIAGGDIARGDAVVVLPSGLSSEVGEIVGGDGPLERASAGDAVTLRLNDEIDVSRGDMIIRPDHRPHVSDQFAATVLWMDDQPLYPGRSYLLRVGTRWIAATVSSIKYRLDVVHHGHIAAKSLELNEIGFCNIMTLQPVPFDTFEDNQETGAFILIDRFTLKTVGAGTIAFPLRRGDNIHPERLALNKEARALIKQQKPCVLWFTGLSGAGKSTIARLVEEKLHLAGCHTYMLDGDNIRHGLNYDLGFTDADRVENIRRVAEVAKLFVDAGLIVLCSFISPFEAERKAARDLFQPGEFFEIFVDTPIEECIRRDPKQLYAKARSGGLKNFTGIDSAYEPPIDPELHLETLKSESAHLADDVVNHLSNLGYFGKL